MNNITQFLQKKWD